MCAMKISSGYVASRLALNTKQKMIGSTSGDPQFKDWEKKYENLDFFVKGKSDIPKGIGSMAIAQEKLDEMKRSPQKRAEFEKLLEDCDKAAKEMKARGGAKLVSQGFVFDEAGGLTGWSLATTNGEAVKYASVLDKEDPGSWFSTMTQYTKVYERSSWQKKFDKLKLIFTVTCKYKFLIIDGKKRQYGNVSYFSKSSNSAFAAVWSCSSCDAAVCSLSAQAER